MTQATATDLELYGLPDSVTDTLTTNEKNSYLDQASARIKQRLNIRYTIPLSDSPPEITRYECVIAANMICVARGLAQDNRAQVIAREYQEVILELRQIADGDLNLSTDTGSKNEWPQIQSDTNRGWDDSADSSSNTNANC